MPFLLVKQNINTLYVDAIAKCSLGAMPSYCGIAKITDKTLPYKYIIYSQMQANEGDIPKSCYERCLKLADSHNCQSIALPILGDCDEGIRHIIAAFNACLPDSDMQVCICIDKKEYSAAKQIHFNSIQSFIQSRIKEDAIHMHLMEYADIIPKAKTQSARFSTQHTADEHCCQETALPASLKDFIEGMDESFTNTLLKLIDEKGLTDVQCYKKANVSKSVFSKLRCNKNYKPSKTTALAFAIALELGLEETRAFIATAGYALSRSNKFDLIIEYFIREGNYDIFEINEALFEFDQVLLGSF